MKEYKYDVLTSGYVSMDHIIKIAEPARVGFTSIVTNADNTKINYGGCGVNIASARAPGGAGLGGEWVPGISDPQQHTHRRRNRDSRGGNLHLLPVTG